MKPELLTEQDIADLEILIRGRFGPQFSEPLLAKIMALNAFVGSLEEGIDGDTDEGDSVQPTWATRMAGWGDDDA